MSSFVSPVVETATSSPGFGALTLVVLLALLVLAVEKAVAENIGPAAKRRLSDSLSVGIIPLGAGSLVLVATALARVLRAS